MPHSSTQLCNSIEGKHEAHLPARRLLLPQVVKRQLLELGDEEFLAETGTIVSQASYHQSVIRINTKLVYAQVRGTDGVLRGVQSAALARQRFLLAGIVCRRTACTQGVWLMAAVIRNEPCIHDN